MAKKSQKIFQKICATALSLAQRAAQKSQQVFFPKFRSVYTFFKNGFSENVFFKTIVFYN